MRGIALAVLALTLVGCASGPNEREVNKEKSAQVNAELGLRYMFQGKNDLALEKLQRALSYDDDSVAAHHYLAELYRRLDEQEKADEHYREALDLEPENSSIHNNYGVFLCNAERYDDAEEQFLEVLENPVYNGRAATYENLGLCLRQGEKNARAEKYFRKALEINPKLPKSLAAMAELSFAQGNMLSARAYIQRYRDVAPHNPRTLWLGIQVERALGDHDAVASYGMLLTGNFPESDEAAKYSRTEQHR